MDSENHNPFAPGAGEPPPLLAGRDEEIREFSGRMAKMLAGKPGGLVVMYGPRGNGKTSLLAELEVRAKQRGARVLELEEAPSADGTSSAAWEFAEARRAPIETTTKGGLNLANVLSGSHAVKSSSLAETVADLRAMADSGPLLLMVDEAHMLPAGYGRSLLHKAQGCVKSRLPLLAVFAGTPGLPSKFQAMHASFWERAKKIKVGRLGSDDDVRAALSIPAKESGCPIDDDALELLVLHSQRYPFFIQMLGGAAWDATWKRNGRSGRITVADARLAVELTDTERGAFYESRRDELFRYGVLDEAEALSEELVAMKDGARLSRRRLGELFDGMISKGLASDPVSALERLVSLGLIWDSGVAEWEPGIPSLCAYLVKHRGVRQTGGSPGSG